jgi:predicted ATP-grasp superfamily ATP-dependent carboligase
MRIFVYEYNCAVAEQLALPASLRAEGQAMQAAIRADLARIPGIETLTLEPGDEEAAFRQAARSADYSLVIAPEADDCLRQRCRWVEEEGGQLLGPTSAAVQLTGDKLALGHCWQERGIPTPPCHLYPSPLADRAYPLVLKPRHGAGSQATFLVRTLADLPNCLAAAQAEGGAGEFVLQPFCPGLAASVAFLVGPRETIPLLPGWQILSTDGRFRYQGGRLPLPPHLAARSIHMARSAVAAVPGLCGYVGVDLILGAAADGSQDQVIEINPRLTTSYVGLRALARTNLAEALLRVVQGGSIGPVEWHRGCLEFEPDGRIVQAEV